MKNPTLTKDNLIATGYGFGTAKTLITEGKRLMVERGYDYYTNSRLGRVPRYIMEQLLVVTSLPQNFLTLTVKTTGKP